MASWLSAFKSLKDAMFDCANAGDLSSEQLLCYQELLYRIEVLETCQALAKSAPVTMDSRAMQGHYKLVCAFIRCIEKERRIVVSVEKEKDITAKRLTAAQSLEKVVADSIKRFSSFVPSNQEHYKQSIENLLNTVLPVWLQFRNTCFNISKQGGLVNGNS